MQPKAQTYPEVCQVADEWSHSALRRLGLSDPELTALSHQGYLQRDQRLVGTRGYCRLRFRFQGRMRTVYLGTDETFIAEVRRELAALQAARNTKWQAARAVEVGRGVRQRVKLQLAPVAAQLGYHFHGAVLRKYQRKLLG